MRLAFGIASFCIAGCAFGNSFFDCPLRQPSKKEFALIEAAARLEGVERINRDSLEYCRQRGDGTRFAKWKTETTVLEDGSEACTPVTTTVTSSSRPSSPITWRGTRDAWPAPDQELAEAYLRRSSGT